jgi:hypothetical protein
MSCGSTTCTSTHYLKTAPLSFPDVRWSWQVPIAWLAGMAPGWERRRQRRQLLELDDRLLSDLGISTRQAAEQAFKLSRARIMIWPIQ